MFKINANSSIELTRGDSAAFNISIKDADGDEYTLQDGDELLFTIKKNVNTNEIILQKSGTHIEIQPEDTEGLSYGDYVYDVQLTIAEDGRVDTIITPSKFRIREEVTW